MNLWSSVGLCNEATGRVVDIIYQNNHQPPDLPIAVIVEFENYRGPVFNESDHCVSQYIQSLSVKWKHSEARWRFICAPQNFT